MNQTQIHAEELAERIRRGDWQPGVKLPSVRAFARDKGISPTTAVEVYELLKLRGLVEAAPRSGIFVSRALRPDLHLPPREAVLLPSASVAPEDLIADMNAAASDPRIFPFGAAIPAPDFLPLAALARLTRQVLRESPEILASYRFPPGAAALRQLLAARYRRLGLKVEAEDVVAASGAIEGIGLVLATVARPGDVVAVESPTYPGILQLVKAQGYRLLEIPLDAQRGLTPEALQQALDKAGGRLRAVVTIPNFANPLGTLVSDPDKQALVALASRAGILLIEDDIYGDLAHGHPRPRPLKAWDRDDSVALCTSFAKTVSPALRAGFVLNARLARQVAAQKYARTSGLSALAEEVLRRFLEQGHYDRHLLRVRNHYQTLVDRHAALVLQQFPAGTRVSQPAGGFILWVELPRGVDSRLLQKRALEKRISMAPGSIFSGGGKHYLNYLRLNCALPWSEDSQRALRELARLATAASRD